jgi:hypothetical protein
MSSILDRVRAKVTPAKQHIQDFQLATQVFFETKPYAIGFKENRQTGKRIYYVSKADPVPDALTAIAADVIQNLRSSLDHIAYQLVLDGRSGTKPDWTVYYPISGSATHYPATRRGKIKGVRQEVVDAIDATEPYKGGKGHALWQLNELNKPDKHELLIRAGSFYGGVEISPTLRTMMSSMLKDPAKIAEVDQLIPPLFLRPADELLSLKIGDELYIEPLDHEMDKDRRFSVGISFNAPGVVECEPAIKTLQDLTNLLDEIITVLGRLLPRDFRWLIMRVSEVADIEFWFSFPGHAPTRGEKDPNRRASNISTGPS